MFWCVPSCGWGNINGPVGSGKEGYPVCVEGFVDGRGVCGKRCRVFCWFMRIGYFRFLKPCRVEVNGE